MSLRFSDPELYDLVMATDDARRRAATRVACELARRRTGLDGVEVDRVAAALERDEYRETTDARALRNLAHELAERDALRDDEAGVDLHRATAAKAYLFALLPDARRAADRAIGMVITACDHEVDVIAEAVLPLLTDDVLAPP